MSRAAFATVCVLVAAVCSAPGLHAEQVPLAKAADAKAAKPRTASGGPAPGGPPGKKAGSPVAADAQDDPVAAARKEQEAERRREVAAWEARAAEQVRHVEQLYAPLKRLGLLTGGQRTAVPLQAMQETEYGRREREIVHERASIDWKDGALERVLFEERRAVQGGGGLRKRRLYVRPIYAPGAERALQGLSLHLIIEERVPSGAVSLVHFPYYTGSTTKGADQPDELPVAERHPDLRTVPVDEHDRRLAMLREVARLAGLLERRLGWIVRSRRIRDQQELDRVFRGR